MLTDKTSFITLEQFDNSANFVDTIRKLTMQTMLETRANGVLRMLEAGEVLDRTLGHRVRGGFCGDYQLFLRLDDGNSGELRVYVCDVPRTLEGFPVISVGDFDYVQASAK